MIKMEQSQTWGAANTVHRGKIIAFFVPSHDLWCIWLFITATGQNSFAPVYVASLAHCLSYNNHSLFLLFIVMLVALVDVWETVCLSD